MPTKTTFNVGLSKMSTEYNMMHFKHVQSFVVMPPETAHQPAAVTRPAS